MVTISYNILRKPACVQISKRLKVVRGASRCLSIRAPDLLMGSLRQHPSSILNHLWHLLNTTSTGHALRCTMRKYPLSWVMLGAMIPDRTPWEIYFRFSVLASVAGHGITRVRVLFACCESWSLMSDTHNQRFSQICVISNFHTKLRVSIWCALCMTHRF